ncbi:MAG: CNNM domain-containing protein, partial [Planctomycetaceae bacterium]
MNEFLPPLHLWLPGVLAMLGLTVASGFFSGSETALFYLSHEELRGMRLGSPGERMAAGLMQQPDRLLTAVLFWNLVINLAYFSTSVVVAQRLIGGGHGAVAAVFGVASLMAIILFGEVLPKSGAVVFRRSLASLVSYPLAVAVRLLDPITPALNRMTTVARRTFWPNLEREP